MVPFASSSTADLSSVLGLIEMTLAGTMKDRSLLAFYAFFDPPIRSSHHGRTEAVFYLVVLQEGCEFFTCEDARAVGLQNPAEAEVEHPLQDVVDQDCCCPFSR